VIYPDTSGDLHEDGVGINYRFLDIVVRQARYLLSATYGIDLVQIARKCLKSGGKESKNTMKDGCSLPMGP